MTSPVRSELRDHGVLVLTLDRPPANAIDEALLEGLESACTEAASDARVRAVMLTGEGPFFCGGFDLRSERRDEVATRRLGELYREAHLRLLELPKPTIAFVRGHATAGGLVLVLACDYRLGAVGDWKLGLNEVAIGASFPRVAMEIVRLRLPHARASELVLGASIYPASEALRLGVLDELLPADTAEATALRRAARLGGFSAESFAHAKEGLVGEAAARVRAETPAEADRAAAVWTSSESRAARARQREKLGMKRGA
ncbi:MAG: enoyl-CoA hydratase/isomerase family protein [Alphaproteobacteria bacterium]